QKAVASLEIKTKGFHLPELKEQSTELLFELIKTPDDRRFFAVMELLSRQETVETIHQTTKIDRFFLHVFQNM
ncbi:hypothetical protein, partial [Staphylococcus aureus]